MSNRKIRLAPSLICSDLCNIESGVRALEELQVDLLHVDLLDGHFSPSMPLGLGSVEQLRRKTRLPFDVHLMVNNNEFFLQELLRIGCEQLCFHYETAEHPDRLLNLLKQRQVKAGIALKPGTPVKALEELIDQCDFVMLMLINPGFAGQSGETQIPYACRKIERCRELIRQTGKEISIEVDGRISLQNLPGLLDAGADTIVCGTGTLFRVGVTLRENLAATKKVIGEWADGKGTGI